MDQNLMCSLHNKPIILVSDQKDNLQFFCIHCMQSKYQLSQVENFLTIQKKLLNYLDESSTNNINILNEILSNFQDYLQKVSQLIEQYTAYITQKIQTIQGEKVKLQTLLQSSQPNLKPDITQSLINMNSIIKEISTKVSSDMKTLPITFNSDQVQASLKNFLFINEGYIADSSIQSAQKYNSNFKYLQIEQQSLKQNSSSYALAFNLDASLLIATSNQIIKVFQFKQEQLKEIQQLDVHKKDVTIIIFMLLSCQFISGCEDGSIIIWKQNENGKRWETFQILKNHTMEIFSIELNGNEDMFASGSKDKHINIWEKYDSSWSVKQTINCQGIAFSLSLNNVRSILVASVDNKKILVIQKKKEWVVVQQISTNGNGYRLSFLNYKQFVFQPQNQAYLQIYDFDDKLVQYNVGKQIQYQNQKLDGQCFIPIRYLKSMNLIFVKFGNCINFIRRRSAGEFIVEQSIDFGTTQIFGCISIDGKYVVTWDDQSNEFQIRKLQEIKNLQQ